MTWASLIVDWFASISTSSSWIMSCTTQVICRRCTKHGINLSMMLPPQHLQLQYNFLVLCCQQYYSRIYNSSAQQFFLQKSITSMWITVSEFHKGKHILITNLILHSFYISASCKSPLSLLQIVARVASYHELHHRCPCKIWHDRDLSPASSPFLPLLSILCFNSLSS